MQREKNRTEQSKIENVETFIFGFFLELTVLIVAKD